MFSKQYVACSKCAAMVAEFRLDVSYFFTTASFGSWVASFLRIIVVQAEELSAKLGYRLLGKTASMAESVVISG